MTDSEWRVVSNLPNHELPSSLDFPKAPLGRPSSFPWAFAAASMLYSYRSISVGKRELRSSMSVLT